MDKASKRILKKEIPVDPSVVATPFKLKELQYPDSMTDKIASEDVLQKVPQDQGWPHCESWKPLWNTFTTEKSCNDPAKQQRDDWKMSTISKKEVPDR